MDAKTKVRMLGNVRQVLKVSVWFGLTVGLLEGMTAAVLRCVPGSGVRVSPDILWTAPLTYLPLFLATSIGFTAIFGFSRFGQLRVLIGLFTAMAFFPLLMLIGRFHQVAALLCSMGAGVQVTRMLRSRETSLIAFMQRSFVPLATVVLLSGLAGGLWEGWHEQHAIGLLPSPQRSAPNILLITLDTLRADHLACYGYQQGSTPNIDQLAKKGVLFENAIANSSWTLPSHASMFTGKLPHEHGADWKIPMDQRIPTLAEELTKRGYVTGAFSANTSYVSREWGLGRGFTRFEVYGCCWADHATRTVYGKKLALNILPRFGYYDIPGRKRAPRVNFEFLRWLDQKGDRPFFAFLNYLDVHDPYVPGCPCCDPDSSAAGKNINFQFQANTFRCKPSLSNSEIAQEIRSYNQCLSRLDSALGSLFDELTSRGLDKNTLVVLTSDHGESFGNHDLFGHGNSLYWETLHVPLIMSFPGRIPERGRIASVVGLHRLPATIMSLIDLDNVHPFPGKPMVLSPRAAVAGDSDEAVVSEISKSGGGPSSYPTASNGLKSVVTDRWQLILSDSRQLELFAWPVDREEARNLAETPVGRAAIPKLKQLLLDHFLEFVGP